MSKNARQIIENRIAQHKANLLGWSEGEQCTCWRWPLLQRRSPSPSCAYCQGSGYVRRGYLLPTEPDPKERERVRHDLRIAISELEIVLKEAFWERPQASGDSDLQIIKRQEEAG